MEHVHTFESSTAARVTHTAVAVMPPPKRESPDKTKINSVTPAAPQKPVSGQHQSSRVPRGERVSTTAIAVRSSSAPPLPFNKAELIDCMSFAETSLDDISLKAPFTIHRDSFRPSEVEHFAVEPQNIPPWEFPVFGTSSDEDLAHLPWLDALFTVSRSSGECGIPPLHGMLQRLWPLSDEEQKSPEKGLLDSKEFIERGGSVTPVACISQGYVPLPKAERSDSGDSEGSEVA